MGRTVFILGAGASFDAGGPLMGNFLEIASDLYVSGRVGEEYENDFKSVFQGRTQLQAVHSKATLDLHNIEPVFAAFEMARRFRRPLGSLSVGDVAGLPAAMRRLIVRTLELRIVFPWISGGMAAPAPYAQFAELLCKIKSHRDVSIITFNYDIACDWALSTVNLWVEYCLKPFEEGRPNSIALIKLHGSMNWTSCKECNAIAVWRLEDFYRHFVNPDWLSHTSALVKRGESYREVHISSWMAQFQPECRHQVGREPVIVPPTLNKGDEHDKFDNLWSHAARHLSEADNIVVIGYSLPPSDEFFRSLYAVGTVGSEILRNFWVFDPEPPGGSVDQHFRALLGEAAIRRYRYFHRDFANAVGVLQAL